MIFLRSDSAHKRILIFIIIWFTYMASTHKNTDSLKLVHIIFRHGDRTFAKEAAYPNDPYANETYYPYGIGQLTSLGKSNMFKLGAVLRERYKNFLDEVYIPDVVYARSTGTDRTKNSLQLVLASLYPPKNTILEWSEINWNPIPINYVDVDKDELLFLGKNTEKYLKLFNNYTKTSVIGKETTKKYKSLFELYNNHSGMKVEQFFSFGEIWNGLQCQKEWGLKLPDWATDDVMKESENAVAEYCSFLGGTPELKRLSGGYILQKIVDDSKLKMDNKLDPPHRKMFLYSAHDVTVMFVLHSLNSYFPHIVPYSAYVILELHEINKVYGFKIFYQHYEDVNPKEVKIPGCEYFCSIDKFIEVLNENFPIP